MRSSSRSHLHHIFLNVPWSQVFRSRSSGRRLTLHLLPKQYSAPCIYSSSFSESSFHALHHVFTSHWMRSICGSILKPSHHDNYFVEERYWSDYGAKVWRLFFDSGHYSGIKRKDQNIVHSVSWFFFFNKRRARLQGYVHHRIVLYSWNQWNSCMEVEQSALKPNCFSS